MALLNNDYICKIFGFPSGTEVLPASFFEDYISRYHVHLLTCMCNLQLSWGLFVFLATVPPFELNGFILLGKFFPADDGDPHWPKWQDKNMPDNNHVCLGCYPFLMFQDY